MTAFDMVTLFNGELMTTSQKITKSEASISAMNAIKHRRAVRDYVPQMATSPLILL